ncbi:unnamed protein product, partial [Vitis vinifera]
MAAMDPIDITSSSDSDFDFEDDRETDTSPVGESVAFANSRILPPWPSTSGHGHFQKVPSPKRASASNGSSSNFYHYPPKIQMHPSFDDDIRASNRHNFREADFNYSTENGDMLDVENHQQLINLNKADIFGADYEKLSQPAMRRTLPSTLQPSAPSAGMNNTVGNIGSSHIHDSQGKSFHPVGPILNNMNYMKEHFGRGNDDEVIMYENSGSRILPPSLMHGKSVPSTQYGGVSESAYRPGVAEEMAANTDERLVYQAALQDLNQPKVEATLPDGLLTVSLLRHQKIALAWMHQKETRSLHCLGGILADDQGLGKTVSMIALIQMQKSLQRRPAAGTLVVCPASVLRQWARELDEKVSEEAKLSVCLYHGGSRTKDPVELAKYDVVLTTYSIVTNEVPKQPLVDDDEGDERNGEKKGIDSSSIDYDCGPLARVGWFRVILDEAQTIKNHRTQVARACCSLRAKRRWCLSGTPIQNAIDDLYSYFRFLKYDPYAVYKSFYNTIKVPISRNSVHGYKKLQAVLRAIMLRRTKGTLIDGTPIINLPPKTICLSKVDFSSEERAFYSKLEADSRSQFKEYAAAGTVNQNYANILLMLLRLRQACDHPLLVKGYNTDSIRKVSSEMAKKLPSDILINLLDILETSAICRVCNDPPEDAVVTMCGHVFCYQCVSEYLTGDDNTCPALECKEQLGADVVFSKATLISCISDELDGSLSNSSQSAEKSINLQNEYSSSKIRAALEILQSHSYSNPETEGPIKAIVFSQWTSMLDLVEMSMNHSCIQYRRLDGTMSLASRDRAVKDFNTDPEVTVMLMSLKAGNLGLNMVAASLVILLDLWWNPTTEDQAVDRAHRIGQTRPVTVSRITIKDTVEDRILALQEDKRKMVASAFGEDQTGGSATRLTVEDLKYLFMV